MVQHLYLYSLRFPRLHALQSTGALLDVASNGLPSSIRILLMEVIMHNSEEDLANRHIFV